LRAFHDEPLTTENFERAAATGNQRRAEGISASAADQDFQRYARVALIRLHERRLPPEA
jgi:hypothetical protein